MKKSNGASGQVWNQNNEFNRVDAIDNLEISIFQKRN
jgi:hypothetical protein